MTLRRSRSTTVMTRVGSDREAVERPSLPWQDCSNLAVVTNATFERDCGDNGNLRSNRSVREFRRHFDYGLQVLRNDAGPQPRLAGLVLPWRDGVRRSNLQRQLASIPSNCSVLDLRGHEPKRRSRDTLASVLVRERRGSALDGVMTGNALPNLSNRAAARPARSVPTTASLRLPEPCSLNMATFRRLSTRTP